jgi:tetratricopeptide (TPR) repeat protein
MQLALQVLDDMYGDMAGTWFVEDDFPEPRRREFLQKMLAFHQRFLEQNSDNPTVLFEMAKASSQITDIHRELGNLPKAKQASDQAIRLLNQLLSDAPSNPANRQELGRQYMSLGRLFPTMGQRKEGEDAYGQSIALKEALAAEYPANSICRLDLARSHSNLGKLIEDSRLDEAEQHYRVAVDLSDALVAQAAPNPGHRQVHATSWHNLGVVFMKKRESRDAEKAFRRAAENRRSLAAEFPLRPTYLYELAPSLNELAIAQEMVGEGQQAEGTWSEHQIVLKKLLAQSPNKPQYRQQLAQGYYNQAGMLNALGKREQAEEAYRQALDLQEKLAAEFPRNVEYQSGLGATLNNLALELRDRSETEEARRLLERAVECQRAAVKADPRNPQYREFLGNHYGSLSRVLLHVKDHAGAAAAAAELPVVFPERSLQYCLAADLLDECAPLARTDAGQTEQKRKEVADTYTRRARELRREAATRNPDDPVVQNALAWFLATCSEPQFVDRPRAVALASQAVQREPQNGAYWTTLGVAQCRAEDWPAAVRSLSKAEEILKETPINAAFFLAKAHWHLGKQRLARQYYDAACQYMEANQAASEEPRRFRAEAAALLGIQDKGKPKKD